MRDCTCSSEHYGAHEKWCGELPEEYLAGEEFDPRAQRFVPQWPNLKWQWMDAWRWQEARLYSLCLVPGACPYCGHYGTCPPVGLCVDVPF